MNKFFFIVGNWKMNPGSPSEAKRLIGEIKKGSSSLKNVKLVVCPPYVYLDSIKSNSKVFLGSQDVSADGPTGPFTGEISLEMLKNVSVEWIILGHSERRARGETNNMINKKLKLALKAGFSVILCVGELDKEEGISDQLLTGVKRQTSLSYIRSQVEDALFGIDRKHLKNLFIAYEPVWALSSNSHGLSASPEHAIKMALYIRKILLAVFGEKIAKATPILYGGSVSKETIAGFLEGRWLQGALVGSKSLNPKEFLAISRIASSLG